MRLHYFLAGLVLAACGDTTTTVPDQLNLDRPVDIAFACYGGLRLTGGSPTATIDQEVVVTSMPRSACDIRSTTVIRDQMSEEPPPDPVPPGQEPLIEPGAIDLAVVRWYGLILQSGPGTVAIAQFATKAAAAFGGSSDVTVLDSNPLIPGTNGISVGDTPIAIATDTSGCYAITANAGSCDMSVLELDSALVDPPEPVVNRLEVVDGAGTPVLSKPAAMAGTPQSEVIGNACPVEAQGLVYVAYPACNLVAGVDTSTGQVVTGILYDAAGVPSIVTNPTLDCPNECALGEASNPGPRPVTLDLELDQTAARRQLVIGSENFASLAVVELDTDSLPVSVRQVALENTTGTLGVTSVALTPTIGTGGSAGVITDADTTGGLFQFIYAVATDGTVRVADIDHLDKECDAQVDPRFLPPVRSVRSLSCLAVGDPATPPRRPLARGPGIELTGDSIPTSVDIIRSPGPREFDPNANPPEAPATLIGYFAIVSSTTGLTYVINIDDDNFRDLYESNRPLLTPIPLAISHQLRDSVLARGTLATRFKDADDNPDTDPTEERVCNNNGDIDASGNFFGGPRASTPPIRNVANGAYGAEKVTQLPSIRQVLCTGGFEEESRAVSELSYSADEQTRATTFPDLRGIRADENWTITWEGFLSADSTLTSAIDGPTIRESAASIDGNGMHIIDRTEPFCDAGVQPYDIVQFRGCDPTAGNIDCPIGYRCYTHPESQLSGLGACMRDDEAERLADACKDFLTSLRRYTVASSTTGELLLVPRRNTLRTTPINGCTDDQQCQDLADYAARTQQNTHPTFDMTEPSPFTYACVADPTRPALNADNSGKRCQMTCEATTDCATGLVCQSGFCMEGVTPPQACVNAPQRYSLAAGDAFTVLGSSSGYVHPIIADPAGRCIVNPAANRLEIGRFGLDPRNPFNGGEVARCAPDSNPLTGQRPDGTFDPNPCVATVSQTDVRPRYVPGTCNFDSPATEFVDRVTEAVRFRNRSFTINVVDSFYPGDQNCILDRQGPGGVPLEKVPVVFPGYQLGFRQVAGFSPLVLPIQPSFPVKVVAGPTHSIWVIDEGDFLSTSSIQPSTRGKVFRVESNALGSINVLE